MSSTHQPLFQRVAIIGLGLMGGSLGMALRASGAAAVVAGFDAGDGVSRKAAAVGAVDEAAPSLATCVVGADLVVLATPVLTMRTLLVEMASALAPGGLLTDLGSTKSEVMAWAESALPSGARFIGGHPMCGAELSGLAAASATLFREAVWCLCPGANADAPAIERLSALIRRLRARPVVVEAARHDAAVARVSHLPLMAAAALVLAARQHEDWSLASILAAGGFRDTTRVASGSPTLARDICLTNAAALSAALDDYIEMLRSLHAQIASGDGPALLARFAEARAARDDWRDQRTPGT